MMINSLFSKTKHIVLCFAAISSLIVNATQWKFSQDNDYAEIAEISRSRNSCDKICIGKVLTKCLKAKQLKAEHIESETIKTDSMCVNAVNSDVICARSITASENICSPFFSSPAICAEQLTVTNICSNGLTTVNAFQQCGLYRATMTFTGNTPYMLGTNVNFNLSLDDPNGDLSFAPAVYTAPLSGYYMVMVQLDQNNLTGVDPILGIPIGNLEILVNGATYRENFVPFLSFHNEQKSTVSVLLSLKTGDEVSARYNVYVMTDASGFSPYAGTVQILGTGTEAQGTIFKIHYLSSDCTDLPCIPCQSIPCMPESCDIPCIEVDCCGMECCDEE